MAATIRNFTKFPSFLSIPKNNRCVPTTTIVRQMSLVTKETIGSVAMIGINRPEKKNAVNRPTADALFEEFRKFEENDDENIAVLYGHGGTFCAGYDLGEVNDLDLNEQELSVFMNLKKKNGLMGPTRMFLRKPVIAAVEGYAVAGGLELALMCDLRVVEETAIFGVFSRRYGVPFVDGGTIRLPALIGMPRALDLFLTGREVQADEALQIGLANRVVPTGTAVGQAMKLADTISRFPQVCLRSDRESVYNSVYSGKNFEQLIEDEANFGMKALEDLKKEGSRDALTKYSRKNKQD